METLEFLLQIVDSLGMVVGQGSASAWQKRKLKHQMEAKLGRKVTDPELLSITSWMKRAEYAKTSN